MDDSIASPPRSRGASALAFVRAAWRPLAVAAAAVVVALGMLALTRTGLFRVREIDVEGVSHLSAREVIAGAGLSRNDNAVWLDERRAERRLASEPWVASADVELDLPWTVTITITERSPVGIVDRAGVLTLVAADGTNLGAPSRRADLPTIAAPPVRIGGSSEAWITQVARALGAMDESLRADVRHVTLGAAGIHLALEDGVRVIYGSGDDAEAKATALAEVLRWAETSGEPVRSINVTAPSAPAIVTVV